MTDNQAKDVLDKLAKLRGFAGCQLAHGSSGRKMLHFVSKAYDIEDSIRYCVAFIVDVFYRETLIVTLDGYEKNIGEAGWKKLLDLIFFYSARGYEHHCIMADSDKIEHDVVVLPAHATLEETLIELDLLDIEEVF